MLQQIVLRKIIKFINCDYNGNNKRVSQIILFHILEYFFNIIEKYFKLYILEEDMERQKIQNVI